MAKCKRLNDYSYFVQCVRKYLKKGYGQKEAVKCAVDECIEQDILRDVLMKHRAEVMDMFLTTFDQKMYEEALREEGREELAEKYEKLSKDHAELSKNHIKTIKAHAERLRDNGIPYDVAREIVTELDEDELKEIYKL